jgi:hypothetical protein
MRTFIPIAIARKTWKRAIWTEKDESPDADCGLFGFGYTDSQNRLKSTGLTEYGFGPSKDSRCCTNSVVSVSASKRLGKGTTPTARLRSKPASVLVAEKIP